MSLYVAEIGDKSAPSIVFLHGAGTSGWMWDYQLEALADFHCITMDLPGHGKSNHIPWLSLRDATQQVAALIKDHANEGRAHIVGLSLGGHVALDLLEHHAEVVDHTVISGVTVEPMPNRIFLKPQLWIFSKFVKTRRSAQKQAQSMGLPLRLQEQFVENLLAMSMESYRNLFTEIANFSLSPALQHVDNPTLIVAGGKEVKIILQSVTVIPDLMPNAQGRIALGYGHGWNVEAPALFSDMVRAWVSDKPLPNGLRAIKS